MEWSIANGEPISQSETSVQTLVSHKKYCVIEDLILFKTLHT